MALTLAACGDDDRPSCPVGTTGCPCAPSDTCNAADDICVAGRCQSRTPGVDGGPADAPPIDAPSADAPSRDATPCGDTTSDRMNCGACGHACRFGDCVDSVCQPGFSPGCDDVVASESDVNCSDICARHGGSCAARACRYSITDASALVFGSRGNCDVEFPDTLSTRDCDASLAPSPGFLNFVRCCCE
ncbi:MAG: hypothetical protein KF901_27950 [Myxococcales bacterium]|nr:hypothetical protein [Myxococcales bacterium]